ncbi:glycosyltransferase [bacterium]|nr:MAG: glycosyltransferase [bacterium]
MHILFFEDKPTRFAGGQERSLFETVQRYAKQGVKVSLCYKEEGDFLPDYQSFCETTFQLESRQIRPLLLKLHIRELLMLSALDKQVEFTHFYANQYFDIPFVTLSAIILNKKSVCHLRLPAPPYLSRQYRFFLEKTDRLIAISKHTRETYRRVGIQNPNMEVVYNVIPKPDVIPPRKKPNGITTFTYAGRICPEKGSELLLRAFAEACKQKSNIELRYYGNVRGENTPPNYIEQLQKLAAQLGVEHLVHFFPHQADFGVIAQQTDVFVLPSLWEAFGRLIVEASHYGIPCIATNVGGIPEVMEMVGMMNYLVDNNKDSLSKNLLASITQLK